MTRLLPQEFRQRILEIVKFGGWLLLVKSSDNILERYRVLSFLQEYDQKNR